MGTVSKLENVKPEEFERAKKCRQQINTLFTQFFNAKHRFTPGQIQTFVLFHACLDYVGQDHSVPCSSNRCPKAYVSGKINCVLALMEGLVRSYWKKDFRKVDIYGGELQDIVIHGLDEYEILGTQRTGYYLFRRGA
jgi:hypothetical protein